MAVKSSNPNKLLESALFRLNYDYLKQVPPLFYLFFGRLQLEAELSLVVEID